MKSLVKLTCVALIGGGLGAAPGLGQTRAELRIFGEVPEVQAAALGNSFTAAATAAAGPAPVVVAQGMMAALDADQQAALRTAYSAAQSVVLLRPGPQDIAALQTLLGVEDIGYALPTGYTETAAYGLDREADGTRHVWAQYGQPPAANAAPGAADETIARSVQAWLVLDGYRQFDPDGSLRAQVAVPDGTKEDLTDIAKSFVDQRNWIDAGCFKDTCNNYQLLHFVYAVHSLDTGEDWFYVQQRGSFNASNQYESNWGGANQDYYMHLIEIDTEVDGFAKNTDKLGLIQSSPQSDEKSRSVSSSVSFDLGGEVSLQTKDAGAKLSGGVSISNSTTVTVEDVTIANTSIDRGNNAKWDYTFAQCNMSCDFVIPQCANVPTLAKSTFTPMNQWIWRADPAVRAAGAQMKVNAVTQLNSGHVTLHFLWVCSIDHRSFAKNVFEYTIDLPYPPIVE